MDLIPRGQDAVRALLARGVEIPNPLTVDIADDVDVTRISSSGVVLHPGTRLRGASTVISGGCVIGAEGPVTIDSCQLGPRVELKGGTFTKSVFLEGSSMGIGAQVREGTLLEEEANGAHTVGLKQTILFPFATLGSLINFCDCLLAGGTSRSDHSEVGSSYIHFNFTPDGDKSTASLFGDVPRGVMLDQPPIFLGGQGGAVGPVTTGFGTVIGAGSILREDVGDGMLVLQGVHADVRKPVRRASYKGLPRLVERNVDYIASLRALDAWYQAIRRPFFVEQELGSHVYEGARAVLASALKERTKRLTAMIDRVDAGDDEGRRQLIANSDALIDALTTTSTTPAPPSLVTHAAEAASGGWGYVETVQGLDATLRCDGTAWLAGIVNALRERARALVPGLGIFDDATNH